MVAVLLLVVVLAVMVRVGFLSTEAKFVSGDRVTKLVLLSGTLSMMMGVRREHHAVHGMNNWSVLFLPGGVMLTCLQADHLW